MSFSFSFCSPWLRRALWGLGGLLALWALAWAAVPPLLKGQVEARGSEALGRKLSIGAIDFQPWSLELTVSDIALATADGAGQQLRIARIYVDAEIASLLHLAPVLDAITVDAPTLQLTHLGGGHYDIDDLLERLNAPSDQPPSAPLKFALYNVTLNAGAVDFTDRSTQTERKHSLRGVHLALPFLSNLDAQRDIKVSPRLAFELNGSTFDTAAEGTPFAQTRQGEATLKVASMDLAPYLDYLPASLPMQLKSAVVDADVRLNFAQTQPAHVSLSGRVAVSKLKVVDTAGADVLGVESIETVLADVRPLERVVKLTSVDVVAPRLRATRNRAGRINLDMASSPQRTVAIKKEAARAYSTRVKAINAVKIKESSSAWTLELAHFALHRGEMAWTDEQVQPQARLALKGLELQADALQWPLSAAATWEGSATLSLLGKSGGKSARLAFKGQGTDQDGRVHASLGEVALGWAAPYVAQFLEPGVAGVLDAELEAVWAAGKWQLAMPRATLRDFALQASKNNAPAAGGRERGVHGRSASEWPQFKRLEVRDAQVDLSGRAGRVGKIALHAPNATLRRDGQGQWMFAQWLKTAPTAAPAAPASSPTAAPWKLSLAELVVEDGTVALDDRSLSKPVRLELSGLKLAMKKLALDGKKPAPLTVAARVKAGRTESGSLSYQGTVMWDPVVLQGSLEAVDIPAHALAPYIAHQLNIDLLRADTSFKGQLRYAASAAGPEVQVRGDAALDDFRANSATEELLRWKSLNVPGLALTMAPGVATRLDVREAALTDFFARVVVNASGRINLQDLVKSDTSAAPPAVASASAASAPVSASMASASPDAIVHVGPISLVKGQVLFFDHFIQPNYSADLSELTGKLSQFSSQAVDGVVQLADLDLRGRAEGTASLDIRGKVNPLAQPLALDITGRVRDLELPPLSPYAIKYAGYGIERGKLSVDVNYAVQPDGQLTASNQLVLNQLMFGDKVEGAPNSLPVKLAVALLADRNGVIDINLPISGSLNDPQFKIGPVVWKVLSNLIVKAVTAPFSLLAHALGGGAGSEDLSAVNFAPGSSVLDEGATRSLDQVVKALNDRPALAMTVVGTASLEVEQEALKAQRLQGMLLAEKRRRAVLNGRDASMVRTVEAAESAALLKAVYRRADITKPRNLVGLTKDIEPAEMEALLLAHITVNDDAMRELALQRGVAVKDYLASRQLPAERLFLGAAKAVQPEGDWTPRAELSLSGR
ncbi:MAG: hypothetical protein A3F78_17825 [Burkholderiales bacterium RIFCSPLOWO2_12_FULL_61_40]|nr:MAG: hypothetical protein A3F78_17825 [Burkholderiales bacterium RIFCSPLOWO2_12_FULL_61_40]